MLARRRLEAEDDQLEAAGAVPAHAAADLRRLEVEGVAQVAEEDGLLHHRLLEQQAQLGPDPKAGEDEPRLAHDEVAAALARAARRALVGGDVLVDPRRQRRPQLLYRALGLDGDVEGAQPRHQQLHDRLGPGAEGPRARGQERLRPRELHRGRGVDLAALGCLELDQLPLEADILEHEGARAVADLQHLLQRCAVQQLHRDGERRRPVLAGHAEEHCLSARGEDALVEGVGGLEVLAVGALGTRVQNRIGVSVLRDVRE
mmetsp:Transcript_25164/g.82559  ORF Transcript_25164/g.82559 Transcript_25164/m.82559 type:complete len:260 (-) Transcript_25164:211-990(-)